MSERDPWSSGEPAAAGESAGASEAVAEVPNAMDEWERMVNEDGVIFWHNVNTGNDMLEDPALLRVAGGSAAAGDTLPAAARAFVEVDPVDDGLGIGGGGPGGGGPRKDGRGGRTEVLRLLDRQWMLPQNNMVDNYVDPHPVLVYAVQDTDIAPHSQTGRAVAVGLYCTSQESDADGEDAYMVLPGTVGDKISRVALLRRIPVRADDAGIVNILDAPPCAPRGAPMRHVNMNRDILRYARLSHWLVSDRLQRSALLAGQLKLWKVSDGRAFVEFSTLAAKKAVLRHFQGDNIDVNGDPATTWTRVRVEEHTKAAGHVVIVNAVRGVCTHSLAMIVFEILLV
jgi:hypothetical protein